MEWEFTDDAAQTGEISIVQYLHEYGPGVRYRIEGMDTATAIGHLTTVLDSMREEQKDLWFRPGAEDASGGPPEWYDGPEPPDGEPE